jgi:transcriptional regulator with XRE-family HTH domain
MQISNNLKILMKSQGWNQKDLAELAETTQASISRTMSGSVPSSEVIYNLKKNANVDPLWLLTGEGEMFLSERVVQKETAMNDTILFVRKVVQNPQMKSLVERLLELDPRSLERISAYLDGLEDKS